MFTILLWSSITFFTLYIYLITVYLSLVHCCLEILSYWPVKTSISNQAEQSVKTAVVVMIAANAFSIYCGYCRTSNFSNGWHPVRFLIGSTQGLVGQCEDFPLVTGLKMPVLTPNNQGFNLWASVTVHKGHPAVNHSSSHLPFFSSNMLTRAIYRGPRRQLVLAFDVGTTYSGISYRYYTSLLRVPINDHSPIIAFLIPVKYPKSKRLQG